MLTLRVLLAEGTVRFSLCDRTRYRDFRVFASRVTLVRIGNVARTNQTIVVLVDESKEEVVGSIGHIDGVAVCAGYWAGDAGAVDGARAEVVQANIQWASGGNACGNCGGALDLVPRGRCTDDDSSGSG